GGDTLVPHHPGKVLAPIAQHDFVDVETRGMKALGLHHDMHVGMLLMSVECHGIAVLEPESLPRKSPRCCQHLVRRRWRWHGKDDVVHQLDAGERSLRA